MTTSIPSPLDFMIRIHQVLIVAVLALVPVAFSSYSDAAQSHDCDPCEEQPLCRPLEGTVPGQSIPAGIFSLAVFTSNHLHGACRFETEGGVCLEVPCELSVRLKIVFQNGNAIPCPLTADGEIDFSKIDMPEYRACRYWHGVSAQANCPRWDHGPCSGLCVPDPPPDGVSEYDFSYAGFCGDERTIQTFTAINCSGQGRVQSTVHTSCRACDE